MRTFDSARYTAPQARIRGSSLRRNEEQVFAHGSLMIPEVIDRDLARTGPLATSHLHNQIAGGSRWQVVTPVTGGRRPLPPCPRRLGSGGPFARGSCFAWRLDSPCQHTWGASSRDERREGERGNEIDFLMMKAHRFFFVCVTRGNNSPAV
jgi:hypothetical protein